jgi:hypothetical protein
MLAPRAPAPSWPKPALDLPAKAVATAWLLVRSDRRGGFTYALWHDAKFSLALADEVKQGTVQAHPITAEMAARGLDWVVEAVFSLGEVPAEAVSADRQSATAPPS